MLEAIWLYWDGVIVCKFSDGHYETFYAVGLDMLARVGEWLYRRQRLWPLRPHFRGVAIVAERRGTL